MNPRSARTLNWACVLLLLLALAISPAGSLALLTLAALCAAIPSGFAAGRIRLVSLGLLVLSVALCIQGYPTFKRHMNAYRQSGLR